MIELTASNLKPADGFSEILQVKILSPISIQDLQKQVSKYKQRLVCIEGGDFNRDALELKISDILVSPEKNRKKDFLHHRNSGLNHVLCTIANKKNKIIAFNFSEVLHAKGTKRARILGQMSQNVKLCRKYKVRMLISSFASDEYDQRSSFELQQFGITIGMTPLEAKKAVSIVDKIISEKVGLIKPGLKKLN